MNVRGAKTISLGFVKHKRLWRLQKYLLETYASSFALFPYRTGDLTPRQLAKSLIKKCRKEAKDAGTDDPSEDCGDLTVKLSLAGSTQHQKIVNKALNDGAKMADFKEFWNLPDLSRRMIFATEEVFRFGQFMAFKENGLTADQAMLEVRKMFPMYGDPDDTSHFSGDDRDLTQALRGRVDAYREKHGAATINEKIKQYSSHNALIRDEIRKGNL